MGFETIVVHKFVVLVFYNKAVPMGFETLHFVSLRTNAKNNKAVPMGFETYMYQVKERAPK